ncbi:hypothetical protein HYU13_06225 [Candidatus Woesearchaeota archaeon]|nr:hypothetical protein [Candidatus Woesearchaeota archaeon]
MAGRYSLDKSYAELGLYFGSCPQGGCREGRLNQKHPTERQKRNMALASGIVQRYLSKGYSILLQVGTPYLAVSEDEASKLIGNIEKSFPESSGGFELSNCMHGRIMFTRTINFHGWREKEQEKLEDLIEKAGALGFFDGVMEKQGKWWLTKQERRKLAKKELRKRLNFY